MRLDVVERVLEARCRGDRSRRHRNSLVWRRPSFLRILGAWGMRFAQWGLR